MLHLDKVQFYLLSKKLKEDNRDDNKEEKCTC